MADQSNIILQIIARLRDELSGPLAKVRKEVDATGQALKGQAWNRPLVDLKKLEQEAAEEAKNLSSSLGSVSSSANALALAGGVGIAAGVAVLGTALREAVVESIAFEKALSQISVRSDDASVKVDAFSETVRDLSVSMGKSAIETANAAALIEEQFGENTGEGIARLLKQVGDLSTIGLGSLNEAVVRAANVTQAFNLRNEQMFETMARIFVVAREARISFRELSDVVAAVGANSVSTGDSAEELALIIAKLSENGLNARQSAAALNTFLANIADKSGKARKSIEAYTDALEDNIKTADLLSRIRARVPESEIQTVLADVVGPKQAAAFKRLIDEDLPALSAGVAQFGDATGVAFGKVNEQVDLSSAKLARMGEFWKQVLSGIGDGIAHFITGGTNKVYEATGALQLNASDLERDFKKNATTFTEWGQAVTAAAARATREVKRLADASEELNTTGPFGEELKRQQKELAEFSKQAVAAERATLEPTRARLDQISQEIQATKDLIRTREEETNGLADNTALQRLLFAQQIQFEQAIVKDLLAHSVALDKTAQSAQAFTTVAVSVAAETAKMAAQFKASADHANELAAVLEDKLSGIAQGQRAVFDFAFRPKIEIEQDLLEAEMRAVFAPVVANIEEQMALDPGNFVAVRDKIDALVAAMQRYRAAASDFGSGFELGLNQKLADFADKTRQGYQFAQTAVESFTDHTAQAIQGLIAGTANLRDILRGFLDDISSAVSRILAERLVSGLIPIATGGVVPGGLTTGSGVRSFAGGGRAIGPQLALIGDNPQRAEAVVPLPGPNRGIPVEFKNGGGGTTVSITYAPQVSALDSRGVREVLSENARHLADLVAEKIASGSHAGLRSSIRGIR